MKYIISKRHGVAYFKNEFGNLAYRPLNIDGSFDENGDDWGEVEEAPVSYKKVHENVASKLKITKLQKIHYY